MGFFYFQIYSGCDTQCRVNGLDGRTEYSVRVAGVRVVTSVPTTGTTTPGGQVKDKIELQGTYSPPGIFTTLVAVAGSGTAGSGSAGESGAGLAAGSTDSAKSGAATVSTKILPHVRFENNLLSMTNISPHIS